MKNQTRRADGKLVSLLDTRPGFRRCAACGEEKPEELFSPKKRDEQGEVLQRDYRCHPCQAAHLRAYRAANVERFRALDRERHWRDREKRVQAQRLARLQNPERIREQDRAEYARNREKHLKIVAEDYRKNREAIQCRREMNATINWAKERFPAGFVLILIESNSQWRACPLDRLRPRSSECMIAEVQPHPDGKGWRVAPWAVIDSRNRVWLQKLQRRENLLRRGALLEAGVSAEEILTMAGGLL